MFDVTLIIFVIAQSEVRFMRPLIAQLANCQTSSHEAVGSIPTQRSTFSNLSLTLHVPLPVGCHSLCLDRYVLSS